MIANERMQCILTSVKHSSAFWFAVGHVPGGHLPHDSRHRTCSVRQRVVEWHQQRWQFSFIFNKYRPSWSAGCTQLTQFLTRLYGNLYNLKHGANSYFSCSCNQIEFRFTLRFSLQSVQAIKEETVSYSVVYSNLWQPQPHPTSVIICQAAAALKTKWLYCRLGPFLVIVQPAYHIDYFAHLQVWVMEKYKPRLK